MSRAPRVFAPEYPSHVTIRGNDHQDIVHTDGDRRRFLGDLGLEAARNGLSIHAYVLMTNHLHFIATSATASSLPRTVQGLGRRYVAYFNLRYGRSGTLWEGRYKANPVTSDRYLATCHRYIDWNPVRARMTEAPGEYPWSSHRHYEAGRADELITPHEWWHSLGTSEEERSRAYRALFDEPMTTEELDAVRKANRKGLALGDRASCARLERLLGRTVTPGQRGRPRKNGRGLEWTDQFDQENMV